jgi:prevent-host-death family protein
MTTVSAYEAKTHLPRLLRAAERGETVIITRHGKPVAKLAPLEGEEADIATMMKGMATVMKGMEALRRRLPRVSAEELLAWRREGQKP